MIASTSGRRLLRTATSLGRRTAIKALTTRAAGDYIASTSQPAVKSSHSVNKHWFNQTQQVAHNSTVACSSAISERDLYDVSKTFTGPTACSEAGIDKLGITGPTTIYKNLTFQELFEHEVANKEGYVVDAEYGKTFAIDTGKFTGRSPKDKWLVFNEGSESAQNVDWGNINQPTTPEVFKELYQKAVDHFNTKEKCYVFDCFVGASPKSQRNIRFVHEMAWPQHFVTNMFIRPESEEQLENFEPDFTVINACSQVNEEWEKHNLHSDVAIVFNVEEKKAVILGTWYGGENKKGIFSLMNYWLPMDGDFPMHCSANVDRETGDSALFFGLSGTGKTTLSADPKRALIGDDEHGWDSNGIFNFEGGCYAKTIDLSEKTEPDIYRAIHTDALLENVELVEENGKLKPDYSVTKKTQNGRVSYPIFHIDGYHREQMAGHPDNIIFLTCDAFGVLPPVSKLTSGQAMYHFISGYTAKVAGTERGITEPTPNFSACFGAAFLALHPTRYADLLQEKIDQHGSTAWLVNTGWSGGAYGVGERMSINTTRAIIDAIHDGSAAAADYTQEDSFDLAIPTALNGVDSHVLNPKNAWKDKAEYDQTAKKLAGMFTKNFEKFAGKGTRDYYNYGPKV